MKSDSGRNEAQFQWLRYQLDSRVKLLLTMVAKWLESIGLPACLVKCSKAIMGELQYAQTSGATSIFK